MKQKPEIFHLMALLTTLLFLFSSCSAIEGIFKAGMWTGILVVVGIIALIIFILTRLGRKG
jgi:magnesium-transporting ATPase (P-type)